MMHIEEWRDVIGYEESYQVSSAGRIRSKIRNTRIADKKEHIMRQKFDDKGYLRVNLYKDRKAKTELVSRLVANAFIPNPNGLPHVGHDDDVKTNNNASNLYWTTQAENNRHNGKLERFHESHNAKIDIIAKKLSTKVKGVALDGSHEVFFDSIQAAKRAGFSNAHISACIHNKRNTHKGYRWERVK